MRLPNFANLEPLVIKWVEEKVINGYFRININIMRLV